MATAAFCFTDYERRVYEAFHRADRKFGKRLAALHWYNFFARRCLRREIRVFLDRLGGYRP
jgi:hypothetical protein